MGFFDSTSNSKTTTQNYDQRVGAEGGGIANRIDAAAGSNVTLSSDDVAKAAVLASQEGAQAVIASAQEMLNSTNDFFDSQLTKLFETVDQRGRSAEANVAAAQALAGEVVTTSQEGSAAQLMKMLMIVGGVAVLAFAINKGVFN